jgi:uncharacterized protein YukE
MQSNTENILSNVNNMQGFCGKLQMRLQHIDAGSTETLPNACSYAADNEFISATQQHLNATQQQSSDCLEESVEDFDWILDAFSLLQTSILLRAQE